MIWRSIAMLVAATTVGCWSIGPVQARGRDRHASIAAAKVAELRNAFTLDGKPVPPLVFRDLGDGDLADSTNVLDSVDIAAATASNLYANPIKAASGWEAQSGTNGEDIGYHFVGSTKNGLVVVITRFNGGGSGTFYTLHILNLGPGRAFDAAGHPYARIDLTTVRAIALGDRWTGEVHIKGNTLVIENAENRKGAAVPGSVRKLLAEKP